MDDQRAWFRSWAALTALWLTACEVERPGARQPQEPVHGTVFVTPAVLEAGEPEGGWPWRYASGGDPTWARSELDDAGWDRAVDSNLRAEPPSGWSDSRIGWFRLRLRLDPALEGKALGAVVRQAGASEIYLDGRRVGGWGTVGAGTEEEVAFYTLNRFQPLPLVPGHDHLLAVRYSNQHGHDRYSGPGFQLTFHELGAATAVRGRRILTMSTEAAFVAGCAAAFAVLHILLFGFFPQARANLYYALFNFALAALYGADTLSTFATDPVVSAHWAKWAATFGATVPVCGILFASHAFGSGVARHFAVLATAGLGVVAWTWTQPGWPDDRPSLLFMAVAFLEMLRILAVALYRRRPGVRIVLLGFLAFLGIGLFGFLFHNEVARVYVSLGLLGLLTSVSIYLARSVGRTEKDLEDRVRELEAARRLQLSLLPSGPPNVSGLDAAFEMRTATEVGGDYYDHKLDDDDNLTIALGDATGHGLDAGLMVVAAKSMFQTTSGGDVAELLGRLSQGIRRLGLRRMNMALVLGRLQGWRLALASAAMPPALWYRCATGTVEEVLTGAPPLGTLVGFRYKAQEIELQPGDAVLLMTDGLPELVSPGGDQLGYARTRELFSEVASEPAAEIVRRLLGAVRDLSGERPLEDDMTLIVLRRQG